MACSEFSLITFSVGKPYLTAQDIIEQAQRSDDPLGHVRNYAGDTDSTIAQIKIANAVWNALCGEKKGS